MLTYCGQRQWRAAVDQIFERDTNDRFLLSAFCDVSLITKLGDERKSMQRGAECEAFRGAFTIRVKTALGLKLRKTRHGCAYKALIYCHQGEPDIVCVYPEELILPVAGWLFSNVKWQSMTVECHSSGYTGSSAIFMKAAEPVSP